MTTRRLMIAALFAALVLMPMRAQEIHTLTTPVNVTTTTWTLQYVTIDLVNSRISAQLVSNAGALLVKTYDATTVPTGSTLLHSLNTGNFSGATSLAKSVYNRLVTDGVIAAGSVSGTPQ